MLTKEDYIQLGRVARREDRAFREGSSWQAKAEQTGWALENEALRVRVQEITPKRASERSREAHIESMVAGYIEAMLWSSGGESDPDEEDDTLEDLMSFELADETTGKVRTICTQFYDENRTDLGAYADLKRHARFNDAYQCIGRDLWFTTAGHGVGFWDRGMGRVGDRLTAKCGYNKAFPPMNAYLGDDRLVYLS